LGLTFHDLINTHRIEEAKKMILDPELNETIEGIAYLVGFNSKSTFHSAFKKFTGLTPSQFKETKK
jgi:AraC-like DNA-binding protein